MVGTTIVILWILKTTNLVACDHFAPVVGTEI